MLDSAATLDTPGAAETTGRLRDWLRSAEQRFAWVRHVAGSAEVNRAAKQFAKPSGFGRARARIALERAFAPCGQLQAVGDGRLPYMCWAALRPYPEADSVAVNLIAVLRFSDGSVKIVCLNWTLHAALAALSDALARGEQDLDGLLLDAHQALLDAPESVAEVTAPLAVPAGGGHFIGHFARSMAGNEPSIVFHAQRWFPDHEPVEAAPIGVAGDGEARLSDGVLCPLRLAGAQFSQPVPRGS